MSNFLLNPYDATLDLHNKEERKLFQDACRGLKDKDHFKGKRESYTDFVKLIEKEFITTRVMEALLVPTRWKSTANTPQGRKEVLEEGIIDIFSSSKATREQVVQHSDRVWEDTSLGAQALKYFQQFVTVPTTDAELNKARHQRRLKHVMMGQIL